MPSEHIIRHIETDAHGHVVGHIVGAIHEERAYIDNLHVESRGRSAGIGSSLITAFIQSALELGATEVYGELKPESPADFEKTAEFYRRNGFGVDIDGNINLNLY